MGGGGAEGDETFFTDVFPVFFLEVFFEDAFLSVFLDAFLGVFFGRVFLVAIVFFLRIKFSDTG